MSERFFLPEGVEITGSLIVWTGDFQDGFQVLLDTPTVAALNRRDPRAWQAVIMIVEQHRKACQ